MLCVACSADAGVDILAAWDLTMTGARLDQASLPARLSMLHACMPMVPTHEVHSAMLYMLCSAGAEAFQGPDGWDKHGVINQ